MYRANPQDALGANRERIQVNHDNATAQRDANIRARQDAQPHVNEANNLSDNASQRESSDLASKIIERVQGEENAQANLDQSSTEIENISVSKALDSLRGYEAPESEMAMSTMEDGSANQAARGAASFASAWEATPIQADNDITSLFNDVAPNQPAPTQSADLGFDSLLSDTPAQDNFSALNFGQNL